MESPGLPRPAVANAGGTGSKLPRPNTAFELKGTMAPLTVIRLQTYDLMQIERQLRTKINQLPQMFLYAPVLLDLGMLEEPRVLAIAALLSLMRAFKLVPVGVINAPAAIGATLAGEGLGLLPSSTATAKLRASEEDARLADLEATPGPRVEAPVAHGARMPAAVPSPPPPPRAAPRVALPSPSTPAPVAMTPAPVPTFAPARAAHGGPLVVTKPVRSGQVVYAQNNDLVVLAPVNPGAQVMADGHVHIYNTLRGRAVAGAQGLPGARIFVQKMEAELVAIADAYVMAEELPAKLRGRPVQVYLEGNECRIEPL